MPNDTNCGTCGGTGAVARDGGFDACPDCSDDATPVELDEEDTTPVPVHTMAELVFGACDGCSEGVPHYCGVRWVDEGTVVRIPVAR